MENDDFLNCTRIQKEIIDLSTGIVITTIDYDECRYCNNYSCYLHRKHEAEKNKLRKELNGG